MSHYGNCKIKFVMRNKSAYLGLLSSIVLLLVIVGVEIYINGRPENVAYCNNGGYPYSNRYYEYGDFAWSNVVWSKIFGSAMVYIELLFLLPFFIYFISKVKGQPNGSYRSIWLKIIMAISSIPLIIILLRLSMYSQPVVADYDTERDLAARTFFNVFGITMFGYYLNMFCWIVVRMAKRVVSVINNKCNMSDR